MFGSVKSSSLENVFGSDFTVPAHQLSQIIDVLRDVGFVGGWDFRKAVVSVDSYRFGVFEWVDKVTPGVTYVFYINPLETGITGVEVVLGGNSSFSQEEIDKVNEKLNELI